METEASFSPKDALGEEYADISSEQAQQMIDSIIPEVIVVRCQCSLVKSLTYQTALYMAINEVYYLRIKLSLKHS